MRKIAVLLAFLLLVAGALALEDDPAQCADGTDNDADELIDCDDPDCDAVSCTEWGNYPEAPEAFCDFPSGLCVCSPTGPDSQPDETVCNDDIDNDCDGIIDCQEINCFNEDGGGFTCGAEADFCDDGFDNNRDGFIDCQDLPSCDGQICGPNGMICDSGCVCPYGEAEEITCDDDLDNDCDGLTDCFDPECSAETGLNVEMCSGICDDGFDNDGDGNIDCTDDNCNTLDNCEYGTELTCDDGLDNDGDSDTDGDDSDCYNVGDTNLAGHDFLGGQVKIRANTIESTGIYEVALGDESGLATACGTDLPGDYSFATFLDLTCPGTADDLDVWTVGASGLTWFHCADGIADWGAPLTVASDWVHLSSCSGLAGGATGGGTVTAPAFGLLELALLLMVAVVFGVVSMIQRK